MEAMIFMTQPHLGQGMWRRAASGAGTDGYEAFAKNGCRQLDVVQTLAALCC